MTGSSEPKIKVLDFDPLERIRQLETEMEEAKGGLQALSLYLSAGMGNDDDPISRFVERIKFGVNEFSKGLERIAEDRANRIRQLEEALRELVDIEDNFTTTDAHAWNSRTEKAWNDARRALGEQP